jgi:Tfp pilus assembly protein PilV
MRLKSSIRGEVTGATMGAVALASERGIALLEVLIAGLVLGIAVTGLAMMFVRGQGFVVAEGDTRVALYLAQQKVEKLLTDAVAQPMDFVNNVPTGQTNAGTCPPTDYSSDATAQHCYSETVSAGAGQTTPSTTQVDTKTYSRKTCVRLVQDNDTTLPSENGDAAPSTWTCPGCTVGAANCSGRTKRIRVAVYPTTIENPALQGDRITLEAVVVNPGP